jgi:hypothetical protein
LTISGECRHPADIEWAKQQSTSFRSRLNQQSEQQQQVYKSSLIYTGTSWDEWNDPHCGVRKRLIDKIRPYWKKKKKDADDSLLLWETLTEDSLLEALINEFESQSVVHIQSTMTLLIHQNEFANTIQRALQRVHHPTAKVRLQFRDKLERLQIIVQQQTMTFQRYANHFQMNEAALPFHIQSVQDWWPIQQFPTTKELNQKHDNHHPPKKRKRIRIDEEDDPDNQNVVNKTVKDDKFTKGGAAASKSNSGLVVKVVERPQNECPINHDNKSQQNSAETTSIRQIKQSYGVGPDQLAQSHDILASEELYSQTVADQIDQAYWEQEQIRDAQRIVKQRQQEYQQLLLLLQQKKWKQKHGGGSSHMEEELWNAREMLREACMSAGDLLLSKSPAQALDYFVQAKQIVQVQQQNSHVITVDNEQEDGSYFRRNLILVLGQAQINCGIAHVEMGWQDALRSHRHFTNAIALFDETMESANQLQEQANKDGVDADIRQAHNLQQLAFRWKGTALWHSSPSSTKPQQNKELAFDMFCKADHILDLYGNDCEFQLERYHAWTSWVDLVIQTMEQMSIRSSSPEWRDRLEEFFEIGIQNAIQTSTILQTKWHENFGPWEEEGIIILTAAQLLESRKEFRLWMKQQIDSALRPLSDSTIHADNNNNNLRKGSLFVSRGDVQSGSYSMSKRPFVLNPQGFQNQKNPNRRRRSPYNLGGTGYSNMGVSAKSPPTAAATAPTPRPKYRPWGDIMIDARTGQWIPKLVYPAVAPEMPAHIKEILDRRRTQDHASEG